MCAHLSLDASIPSEPGVLDGAILLVRACRSRRDPGVVFMELENWMLLVFTSIQGCFCRKLQKVKSYQDGVGTALRRRENRVWRQGT